MFDNDDDDDDNADILCANEAKKKGEKSICIFNWSVAYIKSNESNISWNGITENINAIRKICFVCIYTNRETFWMGVITDKILHVFHMVNAEDVNSLRGINA